MGDSIFAATDGTVVYAEQGLRGYGNLVIVKHNDTYLSAYAHASRILVGEQEKVSVGQKIAEIGSTGTDKVMLHFEIRQNGSRSTPFNTYQRKRGAKSNELLKLAKVRRNNPGRKSRRIWSLSKNNCRKNQ